MNRLATLSLLAALAAFAPTPALAPAAADAPEPAPPACEARLGAGNYDAFLRTTFVEMGLGAGASVGSRVRAPDSFHSSDRPVTGLIADVVDTGWQAPSGDFVLRGAPEETWVLDVAGVSRVNSRNQGHMELPGEWIHVGCTDTEATAVWQTRFDDEPVRVTHSFEIPVDGRYVVVRVTLENRTDTDLEDVYYLRNVDPDNDQSLHGSYYTVNQVRAQPRPGSALAMVEATQQFGDGFASESRMALLANDDRARAAHGGFRNRSASAVWHGDGVSHSGRNRADRAISLAYRLDLPAGESTELIFAYGLGDGVEAAMSALGGRLPSAPTKPRIAIEPRDFTTRPGR